MLQVECLTGELWCVQPVGVVGAITPWNFPLAMITRKVLLILSMQILSSDYMCVAVSVWMFLNLLAAAPGMWHIHLSSWIVRTCTCSHQITGPHGILTGGTSISSRMHNHCEACRANSFDSLGCCWTCSSSWHSPCISPSRYFFIPCLFHGLEWLGMKYYPQLPFL